MSVHTGKSGLIKVGSNAIAEIKSYSLEESADTIEVTKMGDSARLHLPSLTSFSGSIDAFWDETDTNGQLMLVIGTEVSLVFFPEGETTPYTKYTGQAIITGKTITGSFDGMVEASFTVQGNGALTPAVVA